MAVNRLPALPESPGQYWKSPPSKAIGDENFEQLYYGVGICLSNWEFLEYQFAALFSVFVESDSWAAARAYGAIVSSSGRREALNQAADVFFSLKHVDADERQYFKRLSAHFKEAGARRNEIAHGMAMKLEGLGAFLVPPPYNSRKTDSFRVEASFLNEGLQHYRYVSEDLRHFNTLFYRLHDPVIAFNAHLQTTYGKLRRHDAC